MTSGHNFRTIQQFSQCGGGQCRLAGLFSHELWRVAIEAKVVDEQIGE